MSAGFAQAASAPRLIFDFHLIIFFLPPSTQCPEGRTKGGMGDGPPGSVEGSVWGLRDAPGARPVPPGEGEG